MSRGLRKSIYSIPEKTCPICGAKVNRRVRGKRCPHCGAYLYSYRVGRKGSKYTIWVTDEPRMKDLALYVISKIQELPSMSEFDFANWPQQLGSSHVLLDICEGDQALAFTLIDAFYDLEIRHDCGIFGTMPRSVSAIISNYNRDKLASLLAWSKKRLNYNRADVEKPQPEQVAM